MSILKDKVLTSIYSENTNTIETTSQPNYTDVLDFYFMIEDGTYTLASTATLGGYELTVTDSTGLVVGEYFGIQEGERSYQGMIQSVVGNVVTMDTPLDFAYSSIAQVIQKSRDLNVDGSVTPVIARIAPASGVDWYITRFIGSMVHASAGDDSKFGDIAGGLTNGIVIRSVSSVSTNNLFNVKTNGEIAERMFDVVYSDRAGGSGEYGTRYRRSIGGPDKNDTNIKLIGDDNGEMQLIIQDDLTSLGSYRQTLQGRNVNY